jgi:hypothetical protein
VFCGDPSEPDPNGIIMKHEMGHAGQIATNSSMNYRFNSRQGDQDTLRFLLELENHIRLATDEGWVGGGIGNAFTTAEKNSQCQYLQNMLEDESTRLIADFQRRIRLAKDAAEKTELLDEFKKLNKMISEWKRMLNKYSPACNIRNNASVAQDLAEVRGAMEVACTPKSTAIEFDESVLLNKQKPSIVRPSVKRRLKFGIKGPCGFLAMEALNNNENLNENLGEVVNQMSPRSQQTLETLSVPMECLGAITYPIGGLLTTDFTPEKEEGETSIFQPYSKPPKLVQIVCGSALSACGQPRGPGHWTRKYEKEDYEKSKYWAARAKSESFTEKCNQDWLNWAKNEQSKYSGLPNYLRPTLYQSSSLPGEF